MRETRLASIQDPIAQGDILRLVFEEREGTAFPRLGVVINADCDLRHNKTDGVVAFLPIYTFREYVKLFWIENFLLQTKRECSIQVANLCKFSQDFSSELERWLETADANDVACALSRQFAIHDNRLPKLSTLLTRLKVILPPYDDALRTFCQLCEFESDPLKFANKQLAQAKRDMGEGHVFLNEIDGEEELGFVVRVRRVYSLTFSDCHLSETRLQLSSSTASIKAIRFAKLNPAFKYRVAQLFSQQFSRVGLPDEIAALNDLTVESLAVELIGDRPCAH